MKKEALAPRATAKPYDRQPGESELSFRAFQHYRELGLRRTTKKVAELMDRAPTVVSDWCGRHRWVERARAWDAEVDRQRTEGELDAVREMRRRQISMAVTMQQLAGSELIKLARQAQQAGEKVTLDPDIILRMIREGAALERLVRGEATENVDIRAQIQVQTIDYTKLSTEQLRALREIKQELEQ